MHQDRQDIRTVNFSFEIIQCLQNRRFLVVGIILKNKSPHKFKHDPHFLKPKNRILVPTR